MEQVKQFKLSLTRIEFKITKDVKTGVTNNIKIDEIGKVTEIKTLF